MGYLNSVMPFGLTYAPAVFQRLIEKVLEGLNPEDGNEFVTAYKDDILVYSHTLGEHPRPLAKAYCSLAFANLKLKSSKCKFVRSEVEYLSRTITTSGLKPSPHLTNAVSEFPQPSNTCEVRRFLGMSYLIIGDSSRISPRSLGLSISSCVKEPHSIGRQNVKGRSSH